MKAKHQWDSAITSCLSDRAILRARPRKVNTMRSKLLIPGLLVSEALTEGAMNTAPQICNGCKESKPLAIAGRLVQSVLHDLRNHLSAIYSNVEFMCESRTTQAEREKDLQDVHAAIQDMTGMLDSLLLLAKTGQPLHPRWASLNKMVEHAVCMVRAYGFGQLLCGQRQRYLRRVSRAPFEVSSDCTLPTCGHRDQNPVTAFQVNLGYWYLQPSTAASRFPRTATRRLSEVFAAAK
jgi:hypothetical protein